MKTGNARRPLVEFHEFPKLPVEVRLNIWEFAASSNPLPIRLLDLSFLSETFGGSNPPEATSLQYHEQRTKKLLPLLQTCYESRHATLRRYSLVPIRDLIFYDAPTQDLVDRLSSGLGNTRLAIDWREDTVIWPYTSILLTIATWNSCIGVVPRPPWMDQLRNVRKLCLTLPSWYFGDDEKEGVEKTDMLVYRIYGEVEDWTRTILPEFPNLKDITFGIVNDRVEPRETRSGEIGDHVRDFSKSPYALCPGISILGSNLISGPYTLNSYQMSSSLEQAQWWEPILDRTSYEARTFQRQIQEARPGIKFHWAFDSWLLYVWEQDWETRASLRKEFDWTNTDWDIENLKSGEVMAFIKQLRIEQLWVVFDERFDEICQAIHRWVKRIIERDGPTTPERSLDDWPPAW